jgi:hypothetical protein
MMQTYLFMFTMLPLRAFSRNPATITSGNSKLQYYGWLDAQDVYFNVMKSFLNS